MTEPQNTISAHSHYQIDIKSAEHLRKRVLTPCKGVLGVTPYTPINTIQLGQKDCDDMRMK